MMFSLTGSASVGRMGACVGSGSVAVLEMLVAVGDAGGLLIKVAIKPPMHEIIATRIVLTAVIWATVTAVSRPFPPEDAPPEVAMRVLLWIVNVLTYYS